MVPKPLQREYVAYYRVSTERQGRSGLCLEAQKHAVRDFLESTGDTLRAEFVEVQSGKNEDRAKLLEALKLCKLTRSTLLIAKLDRLSRNAAFLLTLQNAGTRFVAVDNPDMNETVVGILAVLAQAERKAISERTKAALAVAKRRGVSGWVTRACGPALRPRRWLPRRLQLKAREFAPRNCATPSTRHARRVTHRCARLPSISTLRASVSRLLAQLAPRVSDGDR